jgi:hypothetical protein
MQNKLNTFHKITINKSMFSRNKNIKKSLK